MNVKRTLVFSILGMSLFASGCATSTGDEDSRASRVCVSVRTINSFNGLSDREIFVTAGVNDHYLFAVTGICNGLEYAKAIAVKDQTGRICGDGFGSIIFRDVGRGRQSCRVRTIERVSSGDEAKEWVTAREAERRGSNKD